MICGAQNDNLPLLPGSGAPGASPLWPVHTLLSLGSPATVGALMGEVGLWLGWLWGPIMTALSDSWVGLSCQLWGPAQVWSCVGLSKVQHYQSRGRIPKWHLPVTGLAWQNETAKMAASRISVLVESPSCLLLVSEISKWVSFTCGVCAS